MIDINLDKNQAKELLEKKIEEVVKNLERELVYWDTNELRRRTCMSWNTIKEHFFYDERCPKVKLGGKYYFPADKMKEFLLEWLEEQKEVS
ncbi:group-specific protein [Halobacillus salinus]|uniref:Group-specific protein n=1 Tax=Halobacillus salinus TaxID=192814 RepID=A0A4Z0H2U4_9BACI|nr:group-specific protein [Halobacillus salinus]TGB04713.1 group-specific protein [Halobacillus salinus]